MELSHQRFVFGTDRPMMTSVLSSWSKARDIAMDRVALRIWTCGPSGSFWSSAYRLALAEFDSRLAQPQLRFKLLINRKRARY
jgi:hypothetical protein